MDSEGLTRAEGSRPGLARRAWTNVQIAADSGEGGLRRVGAGAKVVLPISGTVVGGAVGANLITTLDPGLVHALAPLGPTAWITAVSAGGASALLSGIGLISVGSVKNSYYDPSRRERTRRTYRTTMRTTYSTAEKVTVGAAALTGAIALGLGIGDITVAHAAFSGAAHVFGDIAVASGIAATVADVNRRAWATGLPPVPRKPSARPAAGLTE